MGKPDTMTTGIIPNTAMLPTAAGRRRWTMSRRLVFLAEKHGHWKSWQKLGCVPADFIRTIEEYNEELKHDNGPKVSPPGSLGKFSKHPVRKPPFYAITLLRFNESASGGIMIDKDFRVRRDQSDDVIPGLYAVGDSASGIFCNQKYGGGSIGELNWAMASGFYAGSEATAYVRQLE